MGGDNCLKSEPNIESVVRNHQNDSKSVHLLDLKMVNGNDWLEMTVANTSQR